MKKINFEELMASVSEQFVEEAASFSPTKVFNTRFVALVACIAIIVTAVPAAIVLNREKDVDAPVVTTPVEDIVVTPGGEEVEIDPLNVIYCSADTKKEKEEAIKNALLNKDTKLRPFVGYDWGYDLCYEKLEYSNDVPQKISFEVGNKTYNCSLVSVYNTINVLSSNDTIRSYAKMAKYTIDGVNKGSANVYYQVATKKILGVFLSNMSQIGSVLGSLSKEDIKTIAEKDLIGLYGENFLKKYDMEINYYKSGLSSLTVYTVICNRKTGQFSNKECVIINYNTAGTMVGISTKGFGAYDVVENLLNDKVLLAAEAEALKIVDGKLVERQKLEIGTDGCLYLEYIIRYVEDDVLKGERLYYKVNAK